MKFNQNIQQFSLKKMHLKMSSANGGDHHCGWPSNLFHLQTLVTRGPFYARFFHRNSNSMENSSHCHPSHEVIGIRYNFFSDMVPNNGVTPQLIFRPIRIVMEKNREMGPRLASSFGDRHLADWKVHTNVMARDFSKIMSACKKFQSLLLSG